MTETDKCISIVWIEKKEFREVKKIVLIIVNLLLVALLGVSSFYLYKVLQNREITRFIESKQTHFIPKGQYDQQKGNVDYRYVIAYFPKDSEGQRIAPVEKIIHQRIKQGTRAKEKSTGKMKELLFISTVDMPSHIPNVRRVEIFSEAYKVSGFKIQPLDNEKPQEILLTESNQRFSLSDLFADMGRAKGLFAEKIKADLESQQAAPEHVKAYLATFEDLDLQHVEFTYEASQIVLHLSEQEVGLPTVTVAINEFFDVVREHYLTETDRKAYETYQAEKQRKATERMVALTFDDGPNPKTTPALLDILKKHNTKATFFILGQNIAGNEGIIKRMVAEGHEIANHSWSHPNFTTLSSEQVKQEVEQTQSALEKITGQRPQMIRPPYGAVNQKVMEAMNLPVMYWSVDSLDWKSRDAKAILEVVKTNTRPGSIILLHDIHQPTVDAVESIIYYLKEQDYSLGTLSNLLGPNLNPNLIYYDRDARQPVQ